VPKAVPKPVPTPVPEPKKPAADVTSIRGRSGRKYKVITPGMKADAAPKPAVTPTSKKERAVRAAAPRQISRPGRKGVGTVRTVQKPPVKAAKPSAKKPAKPAAREEPSSLENTILIGLDKGPASMKVLVKRTRLNQTKIMPVLKKLTDKGMVESKQIGRIKKFRLSRKADELLHPVKFPFTLFKSKKRKKRRGRRRKLSRRQKIRRLDYAIAALFIVILVVVAYFLIIVTNIMEESGDDGSTDDNQNPDTIAPVILWEDSPESISRASGPLEVNLEVLEPGLNPSGAAMNTMKVMYGFATSEDLLEPNLGPWKQSSPLIEQHNARLVIAEPWGDYNNSYLFIRCTVRDKAGNYGNELFKVSIDI
jgi:predicted transcriptional regulator